MIERVSLRSRLLIGLLVIVAGGLVMADALIYTQLRDYLYDQTDQQLLAARAVVLRAVDDGRRGPRFGAVPAGPSALAPGTYGALLSPDGTVLGAVSFDDDKVPNPVPAFPTEITADDVAFSTGSVDGSTRFRVVASDARGAVLVVAVPLDDVDRTLDRLVAVEALVTIGVLISLGGVSWWLVRLGLRPLARIETTAEAIAAGDLSQRVEHAAPNTEIGRLGLALNEMLAQIEQAFTERQASEDRLRRFLADASHELRTPLTSIRGYAELFRRGAASRPEDLAKAMRRIEEESARMGVLVDDLLLLARLDQGRPLECEPVDLVRLGRDAVADAGVVHPDRTVVVEADGEVSVMGDDARLRQVAANLVGNALHHTPPDHPVIVRVGVTGKEATLEVVDRGPGLSEEDRQRVFERFYRADASRSRAEGGVGLGLAIVAAIAGAHGGRAEVESVLGEGATFRVVLPAGNSATPAAPTVDVSH
ncbi:MAG: sensor histidine kinase [Acidimicrobiales bacterium]